MKNTDVIYVKKYYDKLCVLCDHLDSNKLWNSPTLENVTLRSIFRHNLAEFLLYLSSSDGFITDEEAIMYSEVTGFNGNMEKMAEYISENDIYSARFENEVPLIFRLLRECETSIMTTPVDFTININTSFSELFADFFAFIADVFVEIDGQVAWPEMEDTNIYINTIKKYITKNSKTVEDYYAMIDSLMIA